MTLLSCPHIGGFYTWDEERRVKEHFSLNSHEDSLIKVSFMAVWARCQLKVERLCHWQAWLDKQAAENALYMCAYTCTCEHMEKLASLHMNTQLPSYVTHKHLPVTALTTKQNKNCIASFLKVEFTAGLFCRTGGLNYWGNFTCLISPCCLSTVVLFLRDRRQRERARGMFTLEECELDPSYSFSGSSHIYSTLCHG